jgi:NosR/NirI family nitrous oxide reductase transcriptional regulator
MRSGGKGPSTIITAGGKPVGLPRAEAINPSST